MLEAMQIVPATPALVESFAGKPPPFTFRGYAGVIGDRVVGLGGVYYHEGRPVLFSEFVEGLARPHRAAAFRFLEKEFGKWPSRLFAICDERFASAPSLLKRLGFSPIPTSPWWIREASHA
jgi:hypothetical protein